MTNSCCTCSHDVFSFSRPATTGNIPGIKVGLFRPHSTRSDDKVTNLNTTLFLPPHAVSSNHNMSSDNDNASTPRTNFARRRQPSQLAVANPFYDNIRQNLELSTGITERIPLVIPPSILERETELPFQWLRDIVRKASAKSADGIIGGEALEDLAMQFYRIELGEQRRLNGVMEHHSNESTTDGVSNSSKGSVRGNLTAGTRPRADWKAETGSKKHLETSKTATFPYSITAGVEKGTKNRYARSVSPCFIQEG